MWLNMSVINYVLVGLLGAMLAVALYAARWDMSGQNKGAQTPPRVVMQA
jgi:hypothetical protein